MKCPKCGYTSFDYLESCKKCNNALGEFKAKYGLRSLLFPNRTQQPIATVVAAALPSAAAAPAEISDSTDFGYDFDSETPVAVEATGVATAAVPQPAPAAPAEDSFDFDSDWDAPAEPVVTAAAPTEDTDDSFDFMADSPEPSPGFSGVSDDLDLDLGDEPTPAATAEETAFEFDDSWGESTPEQTPPATVADLGEETIPEFAAETFEFAEDSADDAISFNDEFDFTDDEMPDLLASSEKSPATAAKLGAKEGPSDPFDQRESAPAGPAPVDLARTENAPEDQPEATATRETGPDAKTDEDSGGNPPGSQLAPAASILPDVPEVAEIAAEAATTVDEPVKPEPALFEDPPEQAEDELPVELETSELPEEPALASLNPTGAPFLRLGAGAVDLLLLSLIYGLFLAAGKLALFPADQAMAPLPLESLADLAIPYFLILFALCFGYFTLFHFLSGQTPGKMVFRLKVESVSGAPIDFAQAFLRSVGGLVSLLCAGIGFLFMLRAPEHRGWNDRLAGTRVIDTAPPLAGPN